MKKTYRISLLLFGILLTAVLCLSAGFLAGTKRNLDVYEQRIALLQEKNKTLLSQQERMEEEAKESLKVVEPYEFVLLEEEGFVAVYEADRKTLYSVTDILLESLPAELQEEIQNGKLIDNEEQLYNFLENYTS